jgi:hypothetical protein
MPYPSKKTDELVAEVMDRLSKGEPLAQICRSDGMPTPNGFRDWCAANEALGIAYARAREDGFDAIAVDALRIADTPLEGVKTTLDEKGDIKETREDMLGHRRLQIETRLKLLAKWDPKRYGELVKLAGADGTGPIQAAVAITFRKAADPESL